MTLLTRRRGSALAVGALVLLGGLVAPSAAHAADEIRTDQIRLETGHIDAFNPVLDDDGTPRLALKEDVTGSHVLRTPESVELFVKPDAQQQVPEDYVPGLPSSVYFLPLTQDHNLIWPGWDTQALIPAFGAGLATDFVVDVDGPGTVFLWSQDSFGSPKSLMHDNRFSFPGTISQPYPAHTHANWAFTDPGTYKLSVRGDITSADGSQSASTQTATYTFVVGERTRLTPEVPTQDGNTVTVPDQKWIAYADGDGNALEAGPHELDGDLTVTASPAYGFDLAEGAPAEWSFSAEPETPATPSISITGLRGHYHQNSPIVLDVTAEPEVEDGRYEWFLQRKDQADPVRVDGADGPQLRITAEQALDDARISATLLDEQGEAIASADPVTIDVDDHGAAPLQQVTISGLAGHYHTGDTAELTASVDPASVLTRYDWFVQRAGESEPTAIEGEHGSTVSFEVTAELEDAQVFAQLSYDDGERYVVSEPVTVHVDDHGSEHPVETELSITGLADAYRVGDTAELTAVQDPETGEDHYHWFIKRVGDEDYSVISGAFSETLEYTVAEEDAGAQIIARLYDHDHERLAESAPVTLVVTEDPAENPGGEDPGSETPGGETPGSENPGGEDPGSETPGGQNPGGQNPGGENSAGKLSAKGAGLATTGADLATATVAGALLLAAGIGTVLLARRRVDPAAQ